ncbi:glycosyltransferase family 4 protein [Achromobacter xylosoxidans]|uniref:glycosyltransferase family 4 protein n=1 Tax=Alcaligenes xylosoxydans xylosoxydans TaxID=85698 RepID=UPI002925D06F|nr:glycosyltransferase family 4 protein [Achromobacter xylosoxidans]BEG76740.1 hypothetical protein HBIAX_03819 [Achromobacter xylosoxidans]
MNLYTFLRRARTALRYGREQGPVALGRLALQMLRQQPLFTKTDIVHAHRFMQDAPVGAPLRAEDAVPANSVNWFIPPVGRGSGGHLNIFRFVRYLEQQGFECRIIVPGDWPALTPAIVENEIQSWFFPLKARAYIGTENAPPAHISIATAWHTAYDVRNFQPTRHKCYFVQDFEPWFFASGASSTFAEETYRFGFTGITAGTWLAGLLKDEYGMVTHPVGFSYDRELYKPMPRRDPDTKRVFFYARPNTPRRAFELGVLVLNEVAKRLPGTVIAFAGADLSNYTIPFAHTNFGIVDLADLPDLYAQCDVALVLSFSNLSLLPLELMACGVPVVSNRAPCTEWLLDESNSALAQPTVGALADAVCELLEDPKKADRLRQAGFACAAATDWAVEGQRMGDILRNLDPTAPLPPAGQALTA